MPESATDVTKPASSTGTGSIVESPEFKEAVAKARDEHRKNLDAEYARKQKELEDEYQRATNANAANQPANRSGDWFQDYADKHGIMADAARDLFNGVVGYVKKQYVDPLQQKTTRSELRSQRSELRATNPRLAKLDDKYRAEVSRILDMLQPDQIGPDTYAATLKYVIGEHVDEIVEESTKVVQQTRDEEPEIIKPGPTPTSSAEGRKQKITLSSEQQAWADERGLAADDFVEIMKKRAQKLEAGGLSKAQVRARLGSMLGSIDF